MDPKERAEERHDQSRPDTHGADASANERHEKRNPAQVTRNEEANPGAGGRADRDPAEGARDEYGTRPGEEQ